MTIHRTYLGCDIAKRFVDLFDPRSGKYQRVANEREALAGFAASLDPGRDIVVLEATGSHDRLLRYQLAARGVGHVRLNPMTARRFAQARGRLAKSDRIDARSLAEYGAAFHPAADAPPCPGRERLAALARRRDQLVEARAVELKRRADASEPIVLADIHAMIAVLDLRIRDIEAVIACELRTDPDLAARSERLMSAPGVGPVTVLTLIAHMPELGRLSPKTAAALAGLAPINDDSGQRSGRRTIAGGRPRVRKALYMAALGAIRANLRFNQFYTALAARSGSKKLAIIAVARKLLTALNAMLRDNKAFA
jgi:transposase